MDWDKLGHRFGELVRPIVLLVSGITFAIGTLAPYVDAIKLGAAGAVVTALFAVKGQDLRAEVRANAETKVAMATATTKTTETMQPAPTVAERTTETTEPSPAKPKSKGKTK